MRPLGWGRCRELYENLLVANISFSRSYVMNFRDSSQTRYSGKPPLRETSQVYFGFKKADFLSIRVSSTERKNHGHFTHKQRSKRSKFRCPASRARSLFAGTKKSFSYARIRCNGFAGSNPNQPAISHQWQLGHAVEFTGLVAYRRVNNILQCLGIDNLEVALFDLDNAFFHKLGKSTAHGFQL